MTLLDARALLLTEMPSKRGAARVADAVEAAAETFGWTPQTTDEAGLVRFVSAMISCFRCNGWTAPSFRVEGQYCCDCRAGNDGGDS